MATINIIRTIGVMLFNGLWTSKNRRRKKSKC